MSIKCSSFMPNLVLGSSEVMFKINEAAISPIVTVGEKLIVKLNSLLLLNISPKLKTLALGAKTKSKGGNETRNMS